MSVWWCSLFGDNVFFELSHSPVIDEVQRACPASNQLIHIKERQRSQVNMCSPNQSLSGWQTRWSVAVVMLSLSLTSATAQMPGQSAPGVGAIAVEETSQGMRATVGAEVMEISVCGGSVIHVEARPDAAANPATPKPWMLPDQVCTGVPFTFE